ncbi:DNA double-strand break repair nuclease NurA [Thermanaerothrix sp. 4228-RoL]|uniref:DNA double-strand break repair nuclease NurA n=1 Tax=Thermanaerothrix solaris TaxID=3058434 RepID=A0ABU3NNW9_9CHLR|nr:DNA double-strand break repair nuclease NurA [Thermanaerothrix sp. 4228-RoL]MDT8898537.1 DNA double-strand break repair nuclease NurA [Thermanaerothrix sp. 4228-RoL]
MMEAPERPFAELPGALVEELLNYTQALSKELGDEFYQIQNRRVRWREELRRESILGHVSSLPIGEIPTTSGIDGSYALERLLANDLAVVAALGVEGLTPPSETRHWPFPHHKVWIEIEPHESETGTLLRAIMMGLELILAAQAPHDVVLLDGSLTTPLIYFNQALNKRLEVPHLRTSLFLNDHMLEFLEAYATILTSSRSDHLWLAIPKYTTRREIASRLKWSTNHDDRALLSFILEPGELTFPTPLQNPSQPWHLNIEGLNDRNKSSLEQTVSHVTEALYNLQVVYYRPYSWMPALRIEMSRSVAENPYRLALAMQAIYFQSSAPAIMEPYPLYLADRMVKQLSSSIPALRQIISQHIAETYPGKIEEVFLGLHGYRTESGV